mgnify:CR=1 FL=1
MLKAHVDNELWLIQQPHHAQVSGFLAAHWGGKNGFAKPGHYPGATHPERWHDEVVLGIAEHDNGWWETEAMPRISKQDGLPVGIGEAAEPTDENEFSAWIMDGFDRWRLGINRLAEPHPYAALLTSLHAYWLYAVTFEDLMPPNSDYLRHFVFGPPEIAKGLVNDPVSTRSFLVEQAEMQKEIKDRLAETPELAGLIKKEHLNAHFWLLQLMDSMSLLLALNDTKTHTFNDVPRSSWDDRVTMIWKRRDARTIELDPYPFGSEDLIIKMPARILPYNELQTDMPPMSRLHGTPLRSITFRMVSPSSS